MDLQSTPRRHPAELKPRRQDDLTPGENHSTTPGHASTVFPITHRASPTFRHGHKFTDLPCFPERYGGLEKKTVEKEHGAENKGQTTLVTRRYTYIKELPGVGPALILHHEEADHDNGLLCPPSMGAY